jgi:hypothetical protein
MNTGIFGGKAERKGPLGERKRSYGNNNKMDQQK